MFLGISLVLSQTPPLALSHAQVIVLTSACHDDSVMVGLCAQVCLLNFVAIVFRATAVNCWPIEVSYIKVIAQLYCTLGIDILSLKNSQKDTIAC